MSAHLRLALSARPTAVVLGPAVAAVALAAACTPALDGPGALHVLRGAALLLAVTAAAAADEPLARLLDASPTPWATRVGGRALPALLVLVLGWSAVLGWASWHGDPPTVALTVELCALAVLGTALSAGLRRWSGTAEPAVLAGPMLAGVLLAAGSLPRRFGLLEEQPWGPPWEAAHLRWTALLLASSAVLVLGLTDPCTAIRRRRPTREGCPVAAPDVS